MEIIFGLIISSLIGLAIGQTRGRALAGFIPGILLGPIGWLLVVVGPNPKKEKEEIEKLTLINQQMDMQKAQLDTLHKIQAQPAHSSIPPPPVGKRTLRIAKDGQDLGDINIPKFKLMHRMVI